MEEKKLNAAESLALIGRMIENTRNRMVRNAGRPLLVWGYSTILTTLVVWSAVYYFGDPRWNFCWMLIPVLGWLGMRLTRPEKHEGTVHTFVDRVLGKIWLVTGLSAWFVSMLTLFAAIRMPILFIILIMMGMGTAITGLIIRFTPATVGGFAAIALAPLSFLTDTMWQPAVFIGGFVVMMVIPGHILNYRSNLRKQS